MACTRYHRYRYVQLCLQLYIIAIDELAVIITINKTQLPHTVSFPSVSTGCVDTSGEQNFFWDCHASRSCCVMMHCRLSVGADDSWLWRRVQGHVLHLFFAGCVHRERIAAGQTGHWKPPLASSGSKPVGKDEYQILLPERSTQKTPRNSE